MIRFADVGDIGPIMEFIDRYWRKNHIMARDRELFEFQHLWVADNTGNKEVSFVISEDSGAINGLLGFIPYDSNHRDITLAIWKTIKSKDTMLGVNMMRYLRENGKVRSINAPGINRKTIPIYQFLGYHTGVMLHWYRLNSDMQQSVAVVDGRHMKQEPVVDNGRLQTERLELFEDALKFGLDDCLHKTHQLNKSVKFIERRYYRHPAYEYIVYGMAMEKEKLLAVFRIQTYDGNKLLRLIDCIGDLKIIKESTPFIDSMMRNYSCEYIDCYETGVPSEYFAGAGWRNVSDTNDVIPEYFSPFEQRNIDIYYMTEHADTVLFKGDGDMDRPN